MKTFLKTCLILFLLLSNAEKAKTQTWINNYDFSGSYNGYDITQIQFLNSNTGWLTLQSGNNVRILKSTNKGKDWTEINSYNIYSSDSKTFFIFLDLQYGYRAHSPSGSSYTILDKTTDGGYNWNRKIDLVSIQGGQPLIIFKNSSEGYLFIIDKNNPWQLQVCRTYDGFENYTNFYNNYPPWQTRYKLNDILLSPSGDIIGIGYNEHGNSYQYTDFYRIWFDGANFSHSYGTSNTYLRFLYGTFINSDLRYLGVQQQNDNYPGTRFYTNMGSQYGTLIDANTSFLNVGGLSFSDVSKGFITISDKVYITTNSGNNWTQEATLNTSVTSSNGHHRVKSFGDVCYTASSYGKFYTRLLGTDVNTNFDWAESRVGSISIDGDGYSTPSTYNIRGGAISLSAAGHFTSGTDTTARFYYWGGDCDGSMDYNHNLYFVNQNKDINADYKSKQVSNVPEALKYSTQVKTIKDTNWSCPEFVDTKKRVYIRKMKGRKSWKKYKGGRDLTKNIRYQQ